MADGKMSWPDPNDWHGGAGEGRCAKGKVKTALIKAYNDANGSNAWNKFEKGRFAKNGKDNNFDFYFAESGQINVKPHGETGGKKAPSTDIMWRDLPIMKK
jgi:hypothetical protein